MLALLMGMMLSVNVDPSKLTVPITSFVDTKQVWMSALSDCESMGSTTIKVWDTNNQWSIGKYQYQYGTWLKYSKKFGTTKANITDGALQDVVTHYVLDTYGSGDWYNCTKIIQKSLGSYPK